jgi:hypothetical protein
MLKHTLVFFSFLLPVLVVSLWRWHWGPKLAERLAEFIGTGIFFPRYYSKTRPRFGKARSLENRGRYLEAYNTFQDACREYPGDPAPHIESMRIALVRLKDPALFEKSYRRGVKDLRSRPKSLEFLHRTYDSLKHTDEEPAYRRLHTRKYASN